MGMETQPSVASWKIRINTSAKCGIWCVSRADSVVETNKHSHATGESANTRETRDIIPAFLLIGEVNSPAIAQKGTEASSDCGCACVCVVYLRTDSGESVHTGCLRGRRGARSQGG